MDPKEEIKSRINIAELIGSYITLKPASAASFKALCPFHAEKTPSFHVSADKGIWRCFGCSEGGDCFSFIMKMEGMEFPEALRFLGEKVGVEVKRYDTKEANERARLVTINDLAAKYYRKLLVESPGAQHVREYAERRGMSVDLQEKFGIGFAPDAWDTLSLFLSSRSYGESECELSGLGMRRRQGSGNIDRFRNRLMIPIRDQHGATAGFTGRVLPGAADDVPKYLNTPETPIFHKGKLLFGLDLAKQAIKRAGFVVIVEGNLDVVASHKAGVENVVASSGTALTDDQISLLKRFTNTMAFCFDGDAAGFEAARKGITIARAAGVDVRAVILPLDAGKDPDEVVQKDPAIWKFAVENTVPIMQYLIDRAIAGKDLSQVDDKRTVAAILLPELKATVDVIEREHWLTSVADILRTDANELRKSIEGEPSKQAWKNPNIKTPTPLPTPQTPTTPSVPHSKEAVASMVLVGIAAQSAEIFKRVSDTLGTVQFTDPWHGLYAMLSDVYHRPQTDAAGNAFRIIRGQLEADPASTELLRMLDHAALEGETLMNALAGKDIPRRITELVRTISAADLARHRQSIESDIRRAERDGDRATVERLIRELGTLR